MIDTKEERNDNLCLIIEKIEKRYDEDGKKVFVDAHLNNGQRSVVLWWQIDAKYESYICEERCDAVVTALFLAAMKYGYKTIKTNYPISKKLYYNLTYHIIPQLYLVERGQITRIAIEAPVIESVYNGEVVATAMSRGIDSFVTLYEYGKDFELEDYRINAFTYFQTGAHHGYDGYGNRGEESKQELYENQLEKTKEYCLKYNYPLIAVASNIDNVLRDKNMFCEKRFDHTHTFRNLAIVMLLQKGIRRYYYASTHTVDEFILSLETDMAYYEQWLIPLLSTGSVEFYQSNQEWSRMEKVEKLSHFEECYDWLQVCLTKSGNCGVCMKCKRTLLELDALGGDVLEKFKNSFDIEKYKQENRKEWFSTIHIDKDKNTMGASFLDEVFVYAAKNNPPRIGDLIKEKNSEIHGVKVLNKKTTIREFPSVKSSVLCTAKAEETLEYLGECGIWIGVCIAGGQEGFVKKTDVELII